MEPSQVVEFWPDYQGALLHVGGRRVELADLSMPDDLVREAAAWVRQYDDSKLPFGESPDPDWVAHGRTLFLAIHDRLAARGLTLIDWEGVWAPDPEDTNRSG